MPAPPGEGCAPLACRAVPSEKRQRKRMNRQAGLAALQAREQRRRRRTRAVAVVLLAAVVTAVVLLATGGGKGGKGGKKVATAPATTVARTTPPTTAAAEPAPCPAPDGSSPQRRRFDAPFGDCIDPARTYTAVVATDVGTFRIRLDPRRAPRTVNNFVALARYHFYDGLTFHRVIPDFVIQGGDPQGDGSGGPGYTFADELPQPGDYRAGSVAMANSGPDTNGSQFFVVTSDKGARTLVEAVGGQARYSLFGTVVEGMDVVRRIEADGTPQGSPKVTHRIVSVTIEES
jgi:cyclophilin family peptidyl-prolyl cis-trans isomerase